MGAVGQQEYGEGCLEVVVKSRERLGAQTRAEIRRRGAGVLDQQGRVLPLHLRYDGLDGGEVN